MSETKVCTECVQSKPLEGFHLKRRGGTSRHAKCRACESAYARGRYLAKRDEILEKSRAWRERNAEHVREHARMTYRRDIDRHRQYQEQYLAENHIKHAARVAVRNALADGTLARACRCGICGRSDVDLEGHHESYEQDRWLDVKWLCRLCHARLHGDEKRQAA